MAKERKGWKPFVEWQQQEVENTFGVKRLLQHNALDELVNNLPTLSTTESELVKKWRMRLELYSDAYGFSSFCKKKITLSAMLLTSLMKNT